MPASFKPEGYNSLSPYLIVDGAEKMIRLLQEIFGATLERKFDLPDGKIMHAEVKIDDSIIMLADSNEKYPPNQTVLHLYVPDAVTTFKKAIAAGCTSEQEPVQKDDPDMRGTFIDFAGNMWSVGTQTAG